ncbi:hypothetical protein FJ251_11350 [bacterium]|nr:hypothetical protein [bacterium]
MPPRRALLALALALGALPARAGDDLIGLFADESATLCAAATTPYTTVSVYLTACLDGIDAIIAAEFALAGLSLSPGYPLGQCTPHWNSPLVIGSLEDDLAIAFTAPLAGPLALLGRLDFLPFGTDWPGVDRQLRVVAGSAQGAVILVDGDAVEREVLGGRFTFNCSQGCDCGPGGTASLSFGEVKQLY